MSIFYEPPPANYEPEFRLVFQAQSPGGVHLALSGSVQTDTTGLPNETQDNEFDIRLFVGPFLRNVTHVVPHITVDGFWNSNSDEDDQQKWDILTTDWETVAGVQGEHRIALRCTLRVRGEESKVLRLGYHLIARARGMGHQGIAVPGPVHD